MIKMKKTNLFIIILVLVLAAASVFLFLEFKKETAPPKEKLFFSAKPENWIYDNPSTIEEDVKIDVFMATEGKTKLEKSQQDYFINGGISSFFYEGRYKGQRFKSEYLPDNFYNITEGMSLAEKRSKADELVLMQITNEFKLNDGKINSFVVAKEEKGKLVFYIFVDEDWKNQLKFTNILWGGNFRDVDSLNEREFDFFKQEQGVYIDKLETDVDWYKEPIIKGGIIVGEINKDILTSLLREEEQNVTYMMVR